jgi:hypothetical protein
MSEIPTAIHVIEIKTFSLFLDSPGSAALHDVSEKKGVSGEMIKALQESMSLKLRGLFDSSVARAAKNNPPKNEGSKPECY